MKQNDLLFDYLDANPAAKQAIRRIMGHQNSYDWNMVQRKV